MERAIVQLPDWRSALINGEKVPIGDVESVLITGACDIPEDSFNNLNNLKRVVISDEVTGISGSTFNRCISLEDICFGKGIQSIGSHTFYRCEKIEKLIIPGNIKRIGRCSFGMMLGLKHLVIEEGVEDIGGTVFDECTDLETIDLPEESIKHIGGHIFQKSKWLKKNKETFVTVCGILIEYKGKRSIEHVSMPDSISGMIHGAFSNASFKEVEVGQRIKVIPYLAFAGNMDLERVIIPEGVEEIGNDVFKNCENLRVVKVPDSLKKVGANSLKPEYLEDCPKKGCVYAGRAVIGCVGNPKAVEIKPGTYSVSVGAFDQAYKLVSIILPETIREINCSFLACSGLSSVVIPQGVPVTCFDTFESKMGIRFVTWKGSEAEEFALEKGIPVEYLDEGISREELIAKATKGKKTNAKTSVIKPSPEKWFRRTGNVLAGISSEGLRTIRENKIKSITLPTEMNGYKIERLVFDCLTFLKEIPEVEELVIPGELKIQGLTTMEGRSCWDFPNTETIKRLIFTGKTGINFYHYNRIFDDSIESITIQESDRFASQDGVIYSKDGKSLVLYPSSKKDKKFIVPKTVKQIWRSAFRDAKYLEELILPEGLETISKHAFKDSSIRKIVNPAGVHESTV